MKQFYKVLRKAGWRNDMHIQCTTDNIYLARNETSCYKTQQNFAFKFVQTWNGVFLKIFIKCCALDSGLIMPMNRHTLIMIWVRYHQLIVYSLYGPINGID